MGNEFKVGQKVFVISRYNKRLSKVEKITPSGFIKVDGTLYHPNGSERTSDSWNSSNIEVATEEDICQFKKQIFISAVYKAMVNIENNLTYEQAVKLNRLLQLTIPEIREDDNNE